VEAVKELRERTGAGILDCKKALDETSGDVEKAMDILRKKGIASASKRVGRQALEGTVLIKNEGNKTAIIELNCETDFVARTDDFTNLAAALVDRTLAEGPLNVAAENESDTIKSASGKTGEKIELRRSDLLTASESAQVYSYLHSNSKIGVLVSLSGKASDTGAEIGRDIAMQIAAANPQYGNTEEIPEAELNRQKEIVGAQMAAQLENKPEEMKAKILSGKISKWYEEVCLLEQPFVKEDKKKVKDVLKEAGNKAGEPYKILKYIRFEVGA